MFDSQAIEDYIKENHGDFVQQLVDLLSIPSVSTDPRHVEDVSRAGKWVANRLASLGLEAELVTTKGHPIAFAQSPKIPGKPTVLVYGHYDVQPPDPLGEWQTPPFEPNFRKGNVIARGATDDKGQMLTHINSLEAWIRTHDELPIQLKYLIEGEEEVGSANLEPFLAQRRKALACDVVVVSDTSQFAPGQPAVTYGLKGIAYYQLNLEGPCQDLHSGAFGGAVTNPANTLAQLLGSLHDEHGRVQIPHFYDDVVSLSSQERKQFAALAFDEMEFLTQVGVDSISGEVGYSTLERRWARPTLDINGLTSGYQGDGSKTVVPARASAKFSCRLVPDQDPGKVTKNLRAYLAKRCPPGVRWELIVMQGSPGIVIPLDNPFMQAASAAIERGFGTQPVFIREGGSIPIVNSFRDQLGADTLLLGWGQNDDNTHGPNEKFSLDDYSKGTRSSAFLWHEIGRLSEI